jgi:hypothetical protein
MQTADCRLPSSDCRLATADSWPVVDSLPIVERRKAVWGCRVKVLVALVAAMTVTSCSETIRTGQASSYLIMTSLQGGPKSDVISDNGSIFADNGTVSLQLEMKDVLNSPTANNFITLTQYRVEYIRSDGHNVQGVDVPFTFTSGLTATVSGAATVPFTLVRVQAKVEAPLQALAFGGGAFAISVVARVTFYGHDQTGREVSVAGNIDLTFADWAG